MTVVSYALGRPPVPALRGGDCRARDLAGGRNIWGPHRFAAPEDCRIANGLLRATVFAAGSTPALAIEARRPSVTVEDYLSDTLTDVLDGTMSTPEWLDVGQVVIDSPVATALLTGVRLVRANRQAVTIRLVAPAIGDAWVTLRRGERMLRIQHGALRPSPASVVRRVRWTDSPAVAGVVGPSRVEEVLPANEGLQRFIASHDPVGGSIFALTTPAAVGSASVGAGVGIDADGDRIADLHSHLADASRAELEVS